jgi:hypothetical protein
MYLRQVSASDIEPPAIRTPPASASEPLALGRVRDSDRAVCLSPLRRGNRRWSKPRVLITLRGGFVFQQSVSGEKTKEASL